MDTKLQVVATIFNLWVDLFYCILCSNIKSVVCILAWHRHTKSHSKTIHDIYKISQASYFGRKEQRLLA